MKSTTYRSEIRFSEWIESMRKDVECTFGILKGRWRILKYGIRLWGMKKCDSVWLTCCALHNWLLEVDGLAFGWEIGVRSNWEMEADDPRNTPFALSRLHKPAQQRRYDLSGMGMGNDLEWNEAGDERNDDIDKNSLDIEKDSTGHIIIRKLSLHLFRSKLIRHFNICFQKNELMWPNRIPKRIHKETNV